ncbi:MAG: hypothetical protein LBQ51_05545 [Desulfovibrio sp.]|jgi:hypothetical protein|nr:hypothetical protein [Desulfovibrio sp.]
MTTSGKIALALGIALAFAALTALFYRSELNAERAAHNATRAKYATEKAWWLTDQRSANATISGLSLEASSLLRNRAADRAAEAERFEIFMTPNLFDCGPATVPRSPEVSASAKIEVVNDKTSKAAVTHINGAFVRVGVRGEGR